MIYGFNFCGSRDQELMELMIQTAKKHCPGIKIQSFNKDKEGYGNGASWESSMLKIDSLRYLVRQNSLNDDDWVLSVDSDVVFTSPEIFKWLEERSDLVGIVGMLQGGELRDCKLGKLHHMSGCAIFLRAHIARKMAEVPWETVEALRADFKAFDITENEDIVISYLAQYVGAWALSIPSRFCDGDLAMDIETGQLKSFYHLNFMGGIQFLGESINGKWDIPRVLRKKGIYL